MSVEAMKQAAVYFCNMVRTWKLRDETEPAQLLFKLRQAIEQAEKQEPVAWMTHTDDLMPLFHKTRKQALGWQTQPMPLYTAPQPQREWVGLDNDDLIWIYSNSDNVSQAITNTQSKLKEKNK